MLYHSKTAEKHVAAFQAAMRTAGLSPVLADIGAAGATPAVWKPIASASTLIGFEPDGRNPPPNFGSDFANAILVPAAVCPSDEQTSVEFILTEYPSCSSVLEPDLESLSSFMFRDFFKPVRRASATATSLNRIFENYKLTSLHWLKVDSQGMDLRILKSLSQSHLDTVLAVDIEPGLIDAYKNEDLFPECHTWLKQNGFWMAELFHQAYAKITPETLQWLESLGYDRKKMLSKLPKSPTCIEGRYLRERAWLKATSQPQSVWLLSMLFGLSANQVGYTFDLVAGYGQAYGRDASVDAMQQLATKMLADMGAI